MTQNDIHLDTGTGETRQGSESRDQISTQELISGNLGASIERVGGRWLPEDTPWSQSLVDGSHPRTGGDIWAEGPGAFTDHSYPWRGVTILPRTKKSSMPFGSPEAFLVLVTLGKFENLFGDRWLSVAVVVDLQCQGRAGQITWSAKRTPGF